MSGATGPNWANRELPSGPGAAPGFLDSLRSTNGRKVAVGVVFTAVFSVFALLGQLTGTESFGWENLIWWQLALWILGGGCASWLLLSVADAHTQSVSEDAGPMGRASHTSVLADRMRARRFALVSVVASLLSWSLVYATYWPMASMNDTAWILSDPVGASIQHPLTYNLGVSGLVSIGRALGGSLLAGVVFASIVQMILWALAVGAVVYYLAVTRMRTWALVALIAYAALNPLVADYSFALVKDSVFSLFVLLLVPLLLAIRRSRGALLANALFAVAFGVSAVGFAVTRNNGLVALVPILVLVIIYSSRGRLRAGVLSAIVLLVALVPLTVTSVAVGKQKFVESVGVPLQMVGYTVTNDPDCLPAESRAFFEQLFPFDAWSEAYTPTGVDSTKDSQSFSKDFLQANRRGFVKAWAQGFAACPGDYMKGYLLQTSALWSVDAHSPGVTGGQSVFTSVVSNYPAARDALIADYAEKGVVNQSPLPEPIATALTNIYAFIYKAIPGPGGWFWLGALAVAGYVYQRRSEWVAILFPTLVIWLTLMVGAPTAGPFRYMYPIVLTVPLAYLVLLGQSREDVSEG